MTVDAILFDFDGVLIESEWAGNAQIADWLTANGRSTTTAEAVALFAGYAGDEFRTRVAAHLGGPIPAGFDAARRIEDDRVMREGVAEVAGAVAFARSLPPALPRAIVSSSSTHWIRTHLAHLGIDDAFAHVFSGKEHVARGKPAPDLYLHAAAALRVPIERCAIIEDSPVGVTGAVASGAFVIGMTSGTHCAPGHGDQLRGLGVDAVAADFGEVAALLGLA